MVAGQRPARDEGVEQREAGFGALRHAHRHRPVQLHHRGRVDPAELTVDPGDHRPVGVGRLVRAGVAGGDDGLQLVRPGPAGLQRALQDPLSLVDLGAVPAAPVLILQRDQVTAPVGAGRPGESCSSISASRPPASGSPGISRASVRASRIASAHRSARTMSAPEDAL